MSRLYSLCGESIQKNLKTKILGRDLHFFDSVTSTFDAADKLSVNHGTLICAKRQTKGRGRMGRSWLSGEGGIYFTLVISPHTDAGNMQIYTSVCALGVYRAISKLVPCGIKWPNDIVSTDGKKLCGILTKARLSGGRCQYISVGVGINANNSPTSPDLPYASSIGAICGSCIDENALLCDVMLEIENCLALENPRVIAEFSKVCITLGSKVRAIYADGSQIIGKCVQIEHDGSLTIQTNDKTLVNINSGEVSVRGIYGEEYV